MDATDYHHRPTVAIIDACTPAALGMKALLQEVVPIMEADTFGSFAELAADGSLRQMESITRARRKVQADSPELKDGTVTELRAAREEEFREYAKAK